jgi:hypothetical protein
MKTDTLFSTDALPKELYQMPTNMIKKEVNGIYLAALCCIITEKNRERWIENN